MGFLSLDFHSRRAGTYCLGIIWCVLSNFANTKNVCVAHPNWNNVKFIIVNIISISSLSSPLKCTHKEKEKKVVLLVKSESEQIW